MSRWKILAFGNYNTRVVCECDSEAEALYVAEALNARSHGTVVTEHSVHYTIIEPTKRR